MVLDTAAILHYLAGFTRGRGREELDRRLCRILYI